MRPDGNFMASLLRESKDFAQSETYCNSIQAQMVVARNQQELDVFRTFNVEIDFRNGCEKIIYFKYMNRT